MSQDKANEPKGMDEAKRDGIPDGVLSDCDLDDVAGAGLASIPVGNIIKGRGASVPVLNINDTDLD